MVRADGGLSALERMIVEHECARLVRHAFNLSDEARYAELVGLFADDAVVVRPSRPDAPLVGREAIAADYAARSSERRTFHICSNIVVDARSRDKAEAYSHVVLYATRAGGPVRGGLPVAEGGCIAGDFRDTLTRDATGWKFSRRHGRLLLTT